MSILLATISRSRPPTAPAPLTYIDRVNALSPNWYLPLGETVGTTAVAQIGPNGIYFNAPQLGVTSIAQNDTLGGSPSTTGKSVGFNGLETSNAPHITCLTPLTGPSFTIILLVQLRDINRAKHELITYPSAVITNGDFGFEVLAGGQTRGFSTEGGVVREVLGNAGNVSQGTAVLLVYQRQSNVAGWSQRIWVDGVIKAEDTTQRTWVNIPAGDIYVGTFPATIGSPGSFTATTDGLIGHIAGWNSVLSSSQIQGLVRAQSVAWAENIDAGSITVSQSKAVSVRQGGWHGKLPLVATAGNGSLVTTTESGEDITVLAGATLGNNDTFSYSFTDANGNTSPSKTVTIDVTAAPSGVNVGTLQAFTRAVIDVVSVSGWPASRTPKAILQQGTHCSAYIRRVWKPNNNNGRFIDFIPGWKKTLSSQTIRLQLDDNSEIDITYTVGHTLPAPSGSGVTRTLDRSATQSGTTYNNWASAVGALTTGDVLVVRAPTGTWADSGGHAIPNYVYDVSTNVTPPAGVNNVTIVAHPDDVAAGRRPVIWRNAGRYARFKYAASAAWQVHADLGGGNVVYESVVTSAEPGHSYFGAYRDQVGDWIGMYPYQAISDAADRSGVMHDMSFAPDQGTNITCYRGPGVLYNKGTDRWEVRLNPPVKQTLMNPNSSAPYPPWDWTRHYAPSNDARNCQIVITDGSGWSNANKLLDIQGRNGWKFYNLDFVYGDLGIDIRGCATLPQFFGCTWMGGAPTEFLNNGLNINNTSSAVLTFGTGVAPTSDLLLDRCTLHGTMPPWSSFGEGKGFDGAPGLGVRREFTSWNRTRCVFRYCSLRHWWHFTWMGDGNNPIKVHFHHCYMNQFGQDGALIQPSPGDYNVNRCFLASGAVYGFTSFAGLGLLRYHTFNVDLGLTTLMCGKPGSTKWCEIEGGQPGQGVNVPSHVHKFGIYHGGHWLGADRKYYNTCVGSQNTVGGFEGHGSGMGTDVHSVDQPNRVFNSIGAVYPGPFAWPNGRSAIAAIYDRGGGNSQFNHNLLFKSAGMLAPGAGSNSFVVVKDGAADEVGTAYASLSALQGATGYDANSTQADPQFVATPAWASSNPYAPSGAFNLGNYILGASSPARTGGRNLNDQSFPDYDFETMYTWVGGNNALFRGALDPNIPLLEQEIGIVGPAPPELV